MPAIDLLIFDLDGTLVDSRQDLTFAVNQTLHQFGKQPLPQEVVVRYVGDGIHKLLERALGETSRVVEAVQRFRQVYSEHLLDHTRLYPGIEEALVRLEDRLMAVVTNKPTEFSERILEGLGVRKFFSVVLGGDALPEMKPSPSPLLEVLQRLEASRETAVMIGDSRSDILAGRQAGVITCWVTWGFRSKEDLQDVEPDVIAHNAAELVRLFGGD